MQTAVNVETGSIETPARGTGVRPAKAGLYREPAYLELEWECNARALFRANRQYLALSLEELPGWPYMIWLGQWPIRVG